MTHEEIEKMLAKITPTPCSPLLWDVFADFLAAAPAIVRQLLDEVKLLRDALDKVQKDKGSF